jgi:hypothetical protein
MEDGAFATLSKTVCDCGLVVENFGAVEDDPIQKTQIMLEYL